MVGMIGVLVAGDLFNTGQFLYCIMLNSSYVRRADIVDPNSQVHANTIKTYISFLCYCIAFTLVAFAVDTRS